MTYIRIDHDERMPRSSVPAKHICGVRLHFLPKSDKGSPALYQDIMFEEERI